MLAWMLQAITMTLATSPTNNKHAGVDSSFWHGFGIKPFVLLIEGEFFWYLLCHVGILRILGEEIFPSTHRWLRSAKKLTRGRPTAVGRARSEEGPCWYLVPSGRGLGTTVRQILWFAVLKRQTDSCTFNSFFVFLGHMVPH